MAFLTALTQCTTLTDFQRTLTTANLKMAIPNSGGRHVVSLDDPTHHCSIKHIVNLYDQLVKKDTTNSAVDHASIINRITQLDEEGIKVFEEVKNRCFITRIVIIILTVLRQWFGNFFNDWRLTLNTIKTTISTAPLNTTIVIPPPVPSTTGSPQAPPLPTAGERVELKTPVQAKPKRRSVTFAETNLTKQTELLEALLFETGEEDQSRNPSRIAISGWKVQPSQWVVKKYEIHTSTFNKFAFLNLDAFLSSIPKNIPLIEYCLELYLFFLEWTWPEKNSFDKFWQESFPKYFCNHMSFCITQLNFTNRLQIDVSHLLDGRVAHSQNVIRRMGKASVTESPANEEGIRRAGVAKFNEVEISIIPFIAKSITIAIEERIQTKGKAIKIKREEEAIANEKMIEQQTEEDRVANDQISKLSEEREKNVKLLQIKEEALKRKEEKHDKECEDLRIKKQQALVEQLQRTVEREKKKLANLGSPSKTEVLDESDSFLDDLNQRMIARSDDQTVSNIAEISMRSQKKELAELKKTIEEASAAITSLGEFRVKKRENRLKEQELGRKEEESINIKIDTSNTSSNYAATECRFLLPCLIPLSKITRLDLSLIGATKDPLTRKNKLAVADCFNSEDDATFKELLQRHPELEVLKVNFALVEGQELAKEVDLDFFKKRLFVNEA